MSEPGDTSHANHPTHPTHSANPSHLTHAPSFAASSSIGRPSTLFQLGAGFGVAGFSLGLLVFLAACFGFGAALYLSPLPIAMGLAGFAFTIAGGVRDPHTEGSHVAASLFICVAAIVGGLLEMAGWLGWRVFA